MPHRRPQPRSERSSETANTPAHGSWRRRVKLLQVVPLWSDHTEIMRSTDAGSNLSQSRCSSSRMLIPWSPLPIASALVVDLTLTQHARPFLWRSGPTSGSAGASQNAGPGRPRTRRQTPSTTVTRRKPVVLDGSLKPNLILQQSGFSKRSGIMRIMGLRLRCDQFEEEELACIELLICRAQTMELTCKDRVLPKAGQ